MTTTTTWQRAALRLKNTDHEKDNPYLDLIRDTHDPSRHLKTIEDELKGTIGKALGKQGEKILYYIRLMQQANEEYQQAVRSRTTTITTCSSSSTPTQQEIIAIDKKAREYNAYRQQAIQARWELLVHRQAAGFIVNNHKTVHEHYQIPDALPIDNDDDDETDKDKKSSVPSSTDINKKNGSKQSQFGDQLDWWQRVGRWRWFLLARP